MGTFQHYLHIINIAFVKKYYAFTISTNIKDCTLELFLYYLKTIYIYITCKAEYRCQNLFIKKKLGLPIEASRKKN